MVRYDRGWDILCDPYQVQQGDWVLKIFRQKGEIAHEDFREFLGIFRASQPPREGHRTAFVPVKWWTSR